MAYLINYWAYILYSTMRTCGNMSVCAAFYMLCSKLNWVHQENKYSWPMFSSAGRLWNDDPESAASTSHQEAHWLFEEENQLGPRDSGGNTRQTLRLRNRDRESHYIASREGLEEKHSWKYIVSVSGIRWWLSVFIGSSDVWLFSLSVTPSLGLS